MAKSISLPGFMIKLFTIQKNSKMYLVCEDWSYDKIQNSGGGLKFKKLNISETEGDYSMGNKYV